MLHQLGLGRLERLADGVALDQLGHLGADHVRAEQLAGLGVEHRLDEALGLAERDRLAVADEREGAGLDRVARLLGLGLGQPDAGDLRVAVRAAGDVAAVERVRVDLLVAELLRDRLGGGDALVARLVRQPRAGRAVADRPQALGRRCGRRDRSG